MRVVSSDMFARSFLFILYYYDTQNVFLHFRRYFTAYLLIWEAPYIPSSKIY
jgi:hypothetical protein